MRTVYRIAAPLAALTMLSGAAMADTTADALLKVLVRKGILTQEEAGAVKAEAEKEVTPPAAPTPKEAPKPTAPKYSLSGYIRARAAFQKYANPSSQFSDRRTRLTLKSAGETSRGVISWEVGPATSSLRDGYWEWNATPAVKKVSGLTLKAGQYMKPFGLENERSDRDTEFPACPVGIATFFPNQRDLGLQLSKGLDRNTDLSFAVMNGNGSGSATALGKDDDNYKDVLLRLTHSVKKVGTFAITGYRGRNTIAPVAAVAAVTGFDDLNGNGVRDPGESTVIISPGKAAVPGFNGDRNRFGLDAVLDNVLGGQVRTEYIRAKDVATNLGAGAKYANADAQAWFVYYGHPVASDNTVAVRYDVYDPDVNNDYRLLGDGEVKTFGVVGIHQVSEAFKLSLAWERPRITRYAPSSKTAQTRNEDVLTLQGQYQF
ncbi:MAG TPA: hypothetical protein VGM37_09985 [Armatimonadota bacterium]